jgi:hypothetical protein
MPVRLALDDQLGLTVEHKADLDAGMGMASGAAARRNFRDAGDGDIAVRKFYLLQRRTLDAALLADSARAGKGEERAKSF